jgi:hypothetical protein
VAGVGGTGVITIGQLLGVAAHLEGKGIVTQDAGGLAQKGGATWSHVLIAATQDDIRTTRVSMASADLVIGCDLLWWRAETVLRMRQGRTMWPEFPQCAHCGLCVKPELGQPGPGVPGRNYPGGRGRWRRGV